MRSRDARGRFAAERERRTRWLNLWLDDLEYRRLSRRAWVYGESLSELVRDIIRDDYEDSVASARRKRHSEATGPRRRQKPERPFGRRHVAVRLSESEFEMVQRCCQELNCSPSLYFAEARILDALYQGDDW